MGVGVRLSASACESDAAFNDNGGLKRMMQVPRPN